jgi:site-specific recombinase XerD
MHAQLEEFDSDKIKERLSLITSKRKAEEAHLELLTTQEKELTKPEYDRLLRAAAGRKDRRLFCLMQTICSTGIRVSELRFITVDALTRGRAEIRCKGKCRTVFMPAALCKLLKQYLKDTKKKARFSKRKAENRWTVPIFGQK